jgi:hypothetical protein
MSKINLHEMFEKRAKELVKQIIYVEENGEIMLDGKVIGEWNNEANYDYPEDLTWSRTLGGFHDTAFKAGYTAALNDLQGKVDGLVEALEFYSVNGLAKVELGQRMDVRLAQEFYVNGGLARQALAEFKNGELK